MNPLVRSALCLRRTNCTLLLKKSLTLAYIITFYSWILSFDFLN